MLTIEVFRPDEMALDLKEKENKKSLKKLRKSTKEQLEKQPDNPYIQIEDVEFDE